MLRIDAHHHLWRYNAEEFAWLSEDMRALRRDFLVADVEDALTTAGVKGAVAVQARQTLEETRFLLECANKSPAICAVVGWVPLASESIGTVLDEFSNEKTLAGVREIAQGQPAGFFDDIAFNRGIEKLTARNLAYDILIYEDQMEEATRFLDRHPRQRFVLDHAAKPKVAAKEMEPWRARLSDLAQRENVFCKLSGMVTEANWASWTLQDLRPYLDACVESFGTARVMAGSDWPICLVASDYAQWWQVLEDYVADFSSNEQARIFGLNAADFYRISSIGSLEEKTF